MGLMSHEEEDLTTKNSLVNWKKSFIYKRGVVEFTLIRRQQGKNENEEKKGEINS